LGGQNHTLAPLNIYWGGDRPPCPPGKSAPGVGHNSFHNYFENSFQNSFENYFEISFPK